MRDQTRLDGIIWRVQKIKREFYLHELAGLEMKRWQQQALQTVGGRDCGEMLDQQRLDESCWR